MGGHVGDIMEKMGSEAGEEQRPGEDLEKFSTTFTYVYETLIIVSEAKFSKIRVPIAAEFQRCYLTGTT